MTRVWMRTAGRAALGVALLAAVATPHAAGAASLCLTTPVASLRIVLPGARLKKGKVSPVVGYLSAAAAALPVAGTSIVSADGVSMAVALEGPRVSVASGGGGNVTPADSTFRALFVEADRRLDVGDTSSLGMVGSTNFTFTVLDCNTVPPIP